VLADLVSVGVLESVAQRALVRYGGGLAGAAVAVLRQRRKPPDDPVSFVLGAMAWPEKYGIEVYRDGRIKIPATEAERRTERLRRQREEREGRHRAERERLARERAEFEQNRPAIEARRAEGEARYRAKRARWERATAVEQQAVRAHLRNEMRIFYRGKPDEDAGYMVQCFDLLAQMDQQPGLRRRVLRAVDQTPNAEQP